VVDGIAEISVVDTSIVGIAPENASPPSRQAYRARAEDRDRFPALQIEPLPARAVADPGRGAHLRPAASAVLAGAATVIVVIYHALADAGLVLGDAGADSRDDAAGLVAGIS
jgi:hypothetical protein